MIPWRPVLVFGAIAVGTTTVIALLLPSLGLTVSSPGWGLLAPIAMWAPALARYVAQRTERAWFTGTLPLARWGITGAQVVLVPLVLPVAVYGVAYAIAWSAGFAHWSPGGGNWKTPTQIAANLVINLFLLGIIGTFTAMGEEIGWRGYLQPRLDAAGLRSSVIVVWLCQVAYHAPLMIWGGYAETGGLALSLTLFAIGDLPISFILAREAYRAQSLWPAVFFHSFHNTISQWLFPKLFAVADDQPWLRGEAGLLPMAGYVLLGTALYIWMRVRGQSWNVLAHAARTTGGQRGSRVQPMGGLI